MSLKAKILLLVLIPILTLLAVGLISGLIFVKQSAAISDTISNYKTAVEALNGLGELELNVALYLSGVGNISDVEKAFLELQDISKKIPELKANMDVLYNNVQAIKLGDTNAVQKLKSFLDNVASDIHRNLDSQSNELKSNTIFLSNLIRVALFILPIIVTVVATITTLSNVKANLRAT